MKTCKDCKQKCIGLRCYSCRKDFEKMTKRGKVGVPMCGETLKRFEKVTRNKRKPIFDGRFAFVGKTI